MTKTKTPLLSFGATGSIANTLTLQKRGAGTLIRTKPTPAYRQTLPQTYQRWLYQHYVAWWNAQTVVTKALWETNARPYHMTGFAYWMRERLRLLPDIAGAWHLDERTGNHAHDWSRNTNHGVITGAVHVPGFIDYGLRMDGLDDFVKCGTDVSLRTAHVTVMCFVEFTTINNWQHLVDNTDNRDHFHGWRLTLNTVNKFRWRIRGTDNNLHALTSDGTYLPNVQYHLAATYDEENLIIYVDGELVKSVAETNPIKYTSYQFAIGNYHWPTDCPDAIIDEVLVLNRALTQAQIKLHSDRRYPS